jgi:dCTP deaminase
MPRLLTTSDSLSIGPRPGRSKVSRAAERWVKEALTLNTSVDLHLGNRLQLVRNYQHHFIYVKQPIKELMEAHEVPYGESFAVHPLEVLLASTYESVTLPDDLVARLEGKSSLARLGLQVHATAGFVDPGWQGYLTLELSNVTKFPILIYPGMKTVQICFMRMSSAVLVPYGSQSLHSKYQGESGPTPSRFYQEFQSGRALALEVVRWQMRFSAGYEIKAVARAP